MINHVFNAKMYHLSPRLIRGLLVSFKSSVGKIILLEDGDVNRLQYEIIFDELDFHNFIFCSSGLNTMIKVFQQDKDSPILFHGGNTERWAAAFKAGCKNVNWICWGGEASKSAGRRRTQSLIKRALGRLYDEWRFRKNKNLYKQFNSIVTLIEPDRQTIINDFSIPANKVEVIPYRYYRKDDFEAIIDELYNIGRVGNTIKPLVLIGNSPMNAPFYMQTLDALKEYTGKIEVHCMYQYPHKKDDTFNNLLKLGRSFFGNDFFIDEQFMEREEYIKYLNKTDVYICSNPEQTGGGAIFFLLLLGKKLYLTGKNYESITGMGGYVHNIKEISHLAYDEFIKFDSRLIQEKNRSVVEDSYSKAFDKWALYFKRIDPSAIN